MAKETDKAAMPLGAIAATAAAADGDLLVIAADDGVADDLGRLLQALDPHSVVAVLPAPDLLTGETGLASASVSARRFAALRALAQGRGRRRLLVTSRDAMLRPVPAPEEVARPLPGLKRGEPVDPSALIELLEAGGYWADERVDEPGEFALRGQVLDLFPANADLPVRAEFAGGKVATIRTYDPVTQLSGSGDVERDELEIVPAAARPSSEAGKLADHLGAPALLLAGGDDILSGDDAVASWLRSLEQRPAGTATPLSRPVETRNPTRVFLKLVRSRREAGDRVVLVGSARDLRFLAARLARSLGDAPQPIAAWRDVADAGAGALLSIEAPAEAGWFGEGVTAIAAADLLGSRAQVGPAAPADPFAGAGAIRRGDVVVHEDHGVAVVQGLERVTAGAVAGDALRLEHAKGAVRLVPVEQLDRVWRYGAEAEAVSLDRLDGSGWTERRREILEAIGQAARALVDLAAERDRVQAAPVAPDRAPYERLARSFGHILTAGQASAIAAVEDDLASGRPMDRLVVGDVGYGKTEVALRAAAFVAMAGRQVAIVAPTTVLARQHLETFRARFEPFGIAVEGLSRLSTAAEAAQVKQGLADGSVRIVIGTQAIASAAFADLALVVIDEEQRFGAGTKAKLRALAEGGHVLTLTATPIPRTLQAALVGLQQMSVITTPPARRQPIHTAVAPFDDARVAAALRRERERAGQSFVVVPRIEDMDVLGERLARIAPELTVVSAHGKMPAAEIDAAMVGFAEGQGDVLLATNIIEAGLDVPRANTMVVWHADRFGLSQLHQLRGRVGRGGRRGQVLLTTEGEAEIAPATLKRLSTLEAFDRLGAGFAISARDLDLRGAGDLVGEEQAGHMKLVGIDLYQHLFALAVRAARGEPVDDWRPELNVGTGGFLPEEWLPDEDLRIELYMRLARLDAAAALDEFREELADRFGALPPEAEGLLAVARVRLLAQEAQVARLDAGPGALALTPHGEPAWTTAAALQEKKGRWLLPERIEEPGERLARAAALLEELAAG